MECSQQSFDKKVNFVIVVTCLHNLHDSQRLMPVICILENGGGSNKELWLRVFSATFNNSVIISWIDATFLITATHF